jgi:hypothetical protein
VLKHSLIFDLWWWMDFSHFRYFHLIRFLKITGVTSIFSRFWHVIFKSFRRFRFWISRTRFPLKTRDEQLKPRSLRSTILVMQRASMTSSS